MGGMSECLNDSKAPKTEALYSGKFLQLIKDGRWEYAQRVNSSGAVMIIAVTPEGELLMAEEYPAPLHPRTIGLPAGIAGDMGQEPTLKAAIRELEEETGYRAAKWAYLCTGPSSPGLTSEMISFYMADELVRVSDGGGVDNEDITVHRIPLNEVRPWLMGQMKQGVLVDPRIFMALYFVSVKDQVMSKC